MHLLIPFAFCSSAGCAQALQGLALPALQKALLRLAPLATDRGDDNSLSPPHERALAASLGLSGADGELPWAALQARKTEGAWAFVSPCHWQIGALHVAMHHAPLPQFEPAESQALLAAMRPYFAEDGITLYYDQAQRWLAQGEVFRGLASASLDRVAGRQLDPWMPQAAQASGLRRLQSEMQMLLYTHPVNSARSERGLLPVNSFWLSGTGALPSLPQAADAGTGGLVVADQLREAALAEDWPAWAQAWQALDASHGPALLAALHQTGQARLTLCGERSAQSWSAQPGLSAWRRLGQRLRPKTMLSLMETL